MDTLDFLRSKDVEYIEDLFDMYSIDSYRDKVHEDGFRFAAYIDEGNAEEKYIYQYVVVEQDERYFQIWQKSCGSYFSDFEREYSVGGDIIEVWPVEVTKIEYTHIKPE